MPTLNYCCIFLHLKACPSAECNKKVIEDGDSYRCEKCNRTYPNFKYRLILPVCQFVIRSSVFILAILTLTFRACLCYEIEFIVLPKILFSVIGKNV